MISDVFSSIYIELSDLWSLCPPVIDFCGSSDTLFIPLGYNDMKGCGKKNRLTTLSGGSETLVPGAAGGYTP